MRQTEIISILEEMDEDVARQYEAELAYKNMRIYGEKWKEAEFMFKDATYTIYDSFSFTGSLREIFNKDGFEFWSTWHRNILEYLKGSDLENNYVRTT